MRVSPADLRAVRAGGVLTRYAVLGEAAFVLVELPPTGSAGTTIEEPCRKEHWGIVHRGELLLRGRHERVFGPGTAFYVPPGRTHRFAAASRAIVAGFTPVTTTIDDLPAGLRALGVEAVRRAALPSVPPTEVRIAGARTRTGATDQVQTVSAVMGRWVFTRSQFGPIGGFGDGWCDLPHWGQVIDGTLLLRWENGEIELLGAGDIFACQVGAGGHRIEVADAATMIDYTPIDAILDASLRRAPRTVAALRDVLPGIAGLDATTVPPATVSARPR